ncbi:ABC transporter substrate-binding protein [Nocardioides panacisoli]
MRRKKALVAGISAAALALTLAACGGSGGGDDKSDGFTNVEGAGGKNPDAKGPAPEVPGAKTGGDITVLAPDPDDGPTSLDPAGLWSVTDNAIAQDLLFRSLTTWQQDPDTGEYTLVPDLATDLGTPNSDFTEWKFTLKDGIKWENGDPVTAEEVKFGMERSFDADTFATGPGTSYSKPYFLGGDKYNGPYASGAKDFPAIQVDGNTLTLKMAKPFPEMDYYGIFPAMGPVPLDAKAPDYGLKPLSTGPYKIQSYEPNQKLVLVKNDQWDPATDPARHQYADTFTFEFGGDPTVAAKTVESDSGSTTLVTNVEGQDYTAAKQAGNDQNMIVGPQPCTSFVMPNYDKVKELQVRQALAFAYPYEDVWSAAGELPGVTRANGVTDDTLGFGLLPPGMAGRKAWNPEIDGETIQYDPEHAKQLLKEAGYDPGEYEVSFVYDATTPQGKAGAEQRKLGYEKSGFSVKMYPYTAGSLYDVWTDPNNKLYKKINLLGTAWCQDWPSPATFLPPILETGAAYNTGNFSESSVDDQMNEIRTLPVDQQADAWGELEQKVMTDYQPVINVGYYQGIFGVGSGIGGFNNDTTVGGAPDYRTTYVK